MSPSSLFVWTVLSLVSRGACEDETEVSCVPLENCVLPCSFNRGENPMILWFKEAAEDIIVHIYYQGQSQFEFQHQNYRNRTSLFEEELSTGNASLLLSEVRGQDEGRYRCFSRPIDGEEEESYVNVKVSAPVLEVSLQQEAEQLLCRSEGLLHKPSVSWRNRTEALHKNQSQTHTSESGGVWSVLSSVSLPHKAPHEYSCNVSTPHSWRSATYRRSSVRHPLDSPVVILCSEPTAPVKSLVWTFNHTETILSWSGPEQVHSESWRRFVVGVSESNSLVLKHLTKGHLGLFSCELHTEHETFFIHTNITEELIISPKDTEAKPHVEGKCEQ
ncbi:butyrophilin subfamily 1 member A1-like isoform X2 [Eucyclogobius newberryi]|uniref:butyrophilin subfamily 1 member A1-like isoform X2 n=1 Tax=Eucyclogobius newberryi TaxID=166745 RepID=UPI003B5BEA88